MNNELIANIAVLGAMEALKMMEAKSGVPADQIMNAILADQDGNAARYFTGLVSAAIREVPAMVEKTAPKN